MGTTELMKKLLEIGCLKFGEFTLKSGIKSPIYIDLRCIISYPSLLKQISEKIWEVKTSSGIGADVICGVPYTALPIASALSVLYDIPMVLKRKNPKDYGTKKVVEGVFSHGQKCLIIEDVVTTGSSVLETVEVLKAEGLFVSDCIVILNRQEGGEANLKNAGITMHSLFQLQDELFTLSSMNLVPQSVLEDVKHYYEKSKVVRKTEKVQCDVTFSERAQTCSNPVLKKLFQIAEMKNSNLCVAVDVVTSHDLLHIAELIGPHICILKTHIDILNDFNETLPVSLKEISKKHNFLILEDRKFADIGNTVIQQYRNGMYKIQDWADIVTVHSLPGESIVEALKMSSFGDKACVLVAQMSTKGALTTENYVERTVALAEKHNDFVIGFISQSRVSDKSNFIHISPGVHLCSAADNLGQQYRTVDEAILRDGADIVIVGRGIAKSENIVEAAKLYKTKAFEAYKKALLT